MDGLEGGEELVVEKKSNDILISVFYESLNQNYYIFFTNQDVDIVLFLNWLKSECFIQAEKWKTIPS